MEKLNVRITFTDELLGSCNSDPNIHEEFIASKAPDAETMEQEIAALGVDAEIEKGKTIFPKENGVPFLWHYQIKGFFKAKEGALRKVSDTKSAGLKAFKKEIDELIFVEPNKIPLIFEGEIGSCQRPLRAQTMQGERVALANSESIPAGATAEFTVVCFNDKDIPLVREWLDMGAYNGMLQWRNSGKGRFTWEEIE